MGITSQSKDATMSWQLVGEPPPLQPGVVHLWRTILGEARPDDLRLLSVDERERAERLRNADGSRRFVTRRAFLRRALSMYTHAAPESLRFVYGEVGKPALDLPRTRVQFNQSDSENWSVMAVTLDDRVGVDIEVLRPRSVLDVVAGEVFTDAERAALASVSEEKRLAAFLTGWTRKEAIIKATGNGLASPLKSIEVSLLRDAGVALVSLGGHPIANWSLLSFDLAEGVLGAIAVEHPNARLLGFESEQRD
jgi:4'-phosphopantetheinyl transferase